jgi:hypothetical protein
MKYKELTFESPETGKVWSDIFPADEVNGVIERCHAVDLRVIRISDVPWTALCTEPLH